MDVSYLDSYVSDASFPFYLTLLLIALTNFPHVFHHLLCVHARSLCSLRWAWVTCSPAMNRALNLPWEMWVGGVQREEKQEEEEWNREERLGGRQNQCKWRRVKGRKTKSSKGGKMVGTRTVSEAVCTYVNILHDHTEPGLWNFNFFVVIFEDY